MDLRKVLGSFACFLALSGSSEGNIDINAQTTQYIQTEILDKKAYSKLCIALQKVNLLYFIMHNNIGFDEASIEGVLPLLKETLQVSRQRMQKNNADSKVYYSTLALYSFLKSKNVVGGIDNLADFDIIEYGKGVEEAQVALKVLDA